jgi:S1-C subfamily serine protease
MNMRILTSAAAFALAWLAAGGAGATTPDKLYNIISPSIWRVVSYDASGKPLAQGSAVVIAPETLLTNCHVLAQAKSFSIRQDNAMFGAKLQYIDVERDMCQIVARNLSAPAVRIGDSDKLVVGQRIYTLGNPLGLELTLSDGLVSALRKDDDQRLRYIQISAPISHGSSGGGLFDEEGRLVGITSAGLDKGQNLNLAIPIKWQQELSGRSRAALARYTGGSKSAAEAAAPEAAAPGKPAFRHTVAPVASGYAAIGDVEKLLAINPRAKQSYEEFLTRPMPRAFALGVGRGWFTAWTSKPKNPSDDPDPAVRVLSLCENFHHRKCVLYAVDDVVVYQQPETKTATNSQGTP